MKPFADGIYFNLDEEAYHADPALGSSNLKELLSGAPNYWWNSAMNPNRPKDNGSTPARIRGKALHKFVLEGTQQFQAGYVRRPDDPEGATPAEKSAITKAAKRDLLRDGQELLAGADYDRIVIAGTMITKDPELQTAFQGGHPEVSLFLTRPDGIRVKCRYDYLKPRGFADLKSITNTMDEDFKECCHKAIGYRLYTLQATHYLEMREQLPALFEQGAYDVVDGEARVASQEQIDFLKKVVAAKSFSMAWVFYQADDAPMTYSRTLSPINPICSYERARIEVAIKRYKDNLAKFGTDIWVLSEPMTELDASELPFKYGQAIT